MKINEIIEVLKNYPSEPINYDSKLLDFISNKETTTDDLLNLLVFLEKQPFKELLSLDIVYQIYKKVHETSSDKTKEQVLNFFDDFNYLTIIHFLESRRDFYENIPDEIFHKFMSLCQNDSIGLGHIKCSIAQSCASSLTMLDFLSNDTYDYVRQLVAYNNRINLKIQHKLSSDKSEAVRRSLSQNTNLDISTLESLVNGESVAIACSALQNKGISDEQRIYIYNKIMNGLLGHPYNHNLLKYLIENEIVVTWRVYSL